MTTVDAALPAASALDVVLIDKKQIAGAMDSRAARTVNLLAVTAADVALVDDAGSSEVRGDNEAVGTACRGRNGAVR